MTILVLLSLSSFCFSNTIFRREKKDTHEQFSAADVKQVHGIRAFQQEENMSQKGIKVTSDLGTVLSDKPTTHNRTARQTDHWCVESVIKTWDRCRQKYVDKFKCYSEYVSCLVSSPNRPFTKPLCQTVYGFREIKYSIHHKCKSLPIDCKCAARI